MIVTTTLLCLPEIEVFPDKLQDHISKIWNNFPDEKLLHNRDENGKSIIEYPKVQYRSHRNQLALFGINEGSTLLNNYEFITKLLELYKTNEVTSSPTSKITRIGISDKMSRYKINDYLFLNEDDHERWRNIPGFVERMTFLQDHIITKALERFCKDFGYVIPDDTLEVTLTNYIANESRKVKELSFLRAHVAFETNLKLPEYIGLGKFKSKGNGILRYFKD